MIGYSMIAFPGLKNMLPARSKRWTKVVHWKLWQHLWKRCVSSTIAPVDRRQEACTDSSNVEGCQAEVISLFIFWTELIYFKPAAQLLSNNASATLVAVHHTFISIQPITHLTSWTAPEGTWSDCKVDVDFRYFRLLHFTSLRIFKFSAPASEDFSSTPCLTTTPPFSAPPTTSQRCSVASKIRSMQQAKLSKFLDLLFWASDKIHFCKEIFLTQSVTCVALDFSILASSSVAWEFDNDTSTKTLHSQYSTKLQKLQMCFKLCQGVMANLWDALDILRFGKWTNHGPTGSTQAQ